MTKPGAGGTAHPNPDRPARPPKTRSAPWVFLGFVIVFIIYGSLFPFDFRDQPESFDTLLSRANWLGNTADALDNFLLFVPLGLALAICFQRLRGRLVAAALAILTLGLGIQVIQLYLPSRTASLSDVLWNGMGLLAGLLVASAVRQWLGKRLAAPVTANPFALLLVLLWFCYESFPFVPTLDYGLLRDHVKSAIIAPPFETTRFVQHLLAALLAGIALQRARLLGRGGLSTAMLGAIVVLLEILVAYGSLRRETLLGMTVGLAGGYLLARTGDKPALTALAAVAAGAYLMTIFTPYRGQIADGGFTLTPFSSFLWRNLTRDLPPLAFEALAIGSLLWAGLFRPGVFTRQPALWASLVFVAVALLEAIRVLVVGFHGDTTTLLIAAVLGSFAVAYRDSPAARMDRHPVPSPASRSNHRRPHRPPWPDGLAHGLSIVLLAVAIYGAGQFPGMPYNIRELFPAGGGIVAALALATAIYLAANSTFLMLTEKSLRRLVLFPLLLPVQGIVIWILLRIGVPLESMYDIVGAPTLGWPWEWEIFLRFLALHQSVATQMVGAVLLVAAICRPALFAGFAYWLVVSLMLAWPLHLMVVDGAATDNLVELMRNNAAFTSSSLLASGILLLFVGGTAIGAAIALPSRRIALLIVALLAAPLAAICFQAGLEPVIVKYGTVFSAAQFLLSPDRRHYLPQADLLIRFALAYALSTAIVATLQLRAWNAWARKCRRE